MNARDRVIVNDWESVIDNDQTELLDPIKDGVIGRDRVHELGELLNGTVSVKQQPRGAPSRASSTTRTIPAWRSNLPQPAASSIARQSAEGSNKVIPTEWLGSDLSAYYKAGFRPSP